MGVKHKQDIPMLGSRVTAPCCSHQPLNMAKTGSPVNQSPAAFIMTGPEHPPHTRTFQSHLSPFLLCLLSHS